MNCSEISCLGKEMCEEHDQLSKSLLVLLVMVKSRKVHNRFKNYDSTKTFAFAFKITCQGDRTSGIVVLWCVQSI